MNIKIWDKVESINGVSAEEVLKRRKDLSNEDEIILITDNEGKITNIEIPAILRSNLGLNGDLTALEIGQAYIDYLVQEKLKSQLEVDKIQELESALLEMSTLSAIQQQENEQAILELSMMLGGI